MGLTVIVGDVHGCAAELEELLDHVRFAEGSDRLVLVGDLVARGPDTHGVLKIARDLRAAAVRGNHEDKLLSFRHERTTRRPLGGEALRVAGGLSEDEWQMLEAMPLWIDLPSHGVRVVHAGVVPGVAFERTPPQALLRIRTVDGRGRWSDDAEAGEPWGARYRGPPHVVFGHHARAEAQFHPWATGIDTGCVYGGNLTAVVLSDDEPMPRGDAARATLRSVRARRGYHPGKPALASRPLSLALRPLRRSARAADDHFAQARGTQNRVRPR